MALRARKGFRGFQETGPRTLKTKCLRSDGLRREKLVLSQGKMSIVMIKSCVCPVRSNLSFLTHPSCCIPTPSYLSYHHEEYLCCDG